jgi:tetratricopeptide (TPR) repeat protein
MKSEEFGIYRRSRGRGDKPVNERRIHRHILDRDLRLWKVLLILGVTLLAYASALNGGYIWDDDLYLTDNNTLTSVHGLSRIWTVPHASPQYYPLVFTTFWLERHLWGLNPLGYHLVNVLLHACVACLLYYLLLSLEVPGAWFAALLFAIHPVNVETVAWISERKNVLSGFFYMLAAIALLKFYGLGGAEKGQKEPDNEKPVPKNLPQRRRGAEENSASKKSKNNSLVVRVENFSSFLRLSAPLRWNLYFAGLLLFGCALLSKTVTCTLPVALLIVLWWKRGRVTRAEALSLTPLFVLGAGMGVLTAWLERTHVGAHGADWGLSLIERFLLAGRILCFYAWKLLWPVHLSFNYERWVVDSGVWTQYLYLPAVIAVMAALWAGRGRIGRGPLAAALFFVASLFPALGFFDVFPFRYSYVADHFLYLAGIGPITLAAAAASTYVLKHHGNRLMLFAGACVLVVMVLAVKTWRQGIIYADAWTLYNETLKENPGSPLAHNNIGSILSRQGRRQEAMAHFTEALKAQPNHEMPHYNLGVELAALGKIDEAIENYEEALRIRPDFERALNNLGSLLAQKGRLKEAVEHWTKAVEIDPDYTGAHYNLLLAYSQLGDSAAVRREYGRIKDLDPILAEKVRHVVENVE